MSRYISADRPLALNTPLGNDVLLPIKVSGCEAMSSPYCFKLTLLAEDSLDFDRLVGREATLSITMGDAPPRRVHGILRRVKEGKRVPGPGGPSTFLRYRAELVAPLWRLSRRIQSRVFRHDARLKISVPDVLRQVLHDEWRLRITLRLSGQYAPRDHVIQYRESDLAFVSRLMEEEGIFYYFVQHEDACEMIVTDSASGCRPAQGSVDFDEVRGGSRGEPRIWDWEKSQGVRAIRHTLRDYNFQKPHSWLEGQQARLVPDTVAIGPVEHVLNRGYEIDGTEMLEVYDYPGGYAHRFDSVGAGGEAQPADLESLSTDKDRVVRLRMQEEAAKCLKVDGAGDVADFAPGCFFRLDKHARGDGIYLLTRVEHAATQPIVPSADATPSYSNTFTCLPEDLPYRPRRKTRCPRIDGAQTAVVCGPAGAKTFVDRFGRIKVQFHWDRTGNRDASSSCWVRVAQTWAGYRIGAFFWPRVGDEVVVSFEEGDPDRPLVVGSVYNALNMPPLEMPGSVLTSGFKSGSLGGDPLKDFNGLFFHDQPGHEMVQVHGQTQTVQTDEERKEIRVGRYERTIVGGPFLRLPGSGSGGGTGDSPKPPDPIPTWDMKSALGNVVKYGYGHCLMSNMGLTVNSSLGAYVAATFNPVGLARLKPSATQSLTNAAWAKLIPGGLRDVLGGFFSCTIGASTLMNYGPSLICGHGWSVKNFAPLDGLKGDVAKGLIGVAALAQMGLAIAPFLGASGKTGFVQYTGPSDVPQGTELGQWICEGVAGLALAAVAAIERRFGEQTQRAEDVEVASRTNDRVRTAIEAGHGPDKTSRAFAAQLSRRITSLETWRALAPERDLAENLFVGGRYNVTAHDVTLTSRNTEATTSITIDARGQVPLVNLLDDDFGQGGQLDLRASGVATLQAAAGADDGNYHSQITLTPLPAAAGANSFGMRIESLDGIRIGGMSALGHTQSAHIDAKGRRIFMQSGGLDATAGPRITLDSDAGTLTLAAGAGATSPRIVVGANTIIISNNTTSLTITDGEIQVR